MRAIKQKKDGSNLITGSRDNCKISPRVLYNSMKFFKGGTMHRGGTMTRDIWYFMENMKEELSKDT